MNVNKHLKLNENFIFRDKEMEFDSQFDLIKAFSKWDKKFNGYMVEER